jgi:glyoxylase-like metal-dependent hydrolase (beta-lactamase superfamily II)
MLTNRAKDLAVRSRLRALILMMACPSAFASSQHDFSIKVFTSPDDQFSVNSVIVEGNREVMLVDAQLTKISAEKVLEKIKATKKPLSVIYLTHEHADHFLGLEVFKGAYPRARILATSAVVDRINSVYREKLDKWQKAFGSDASSQMVEVTKFDGGNIDFEGSRIQVIKDIQGDTDQNTMLWIPGQRVLIAGDVLFDDIHVYTGETDDKARTRWLETLRRVRELAPLVVVPGHSKVDPDLQPSTSIEFTEKYLLAFEEELKKAKDPEGLINAMKARFPSAGLVLALERGARANVGRGQTN